MMIELASIGERAASSDRRMEPRPRVLKDAMLTFNAARSAVECTIRNLSRSGAMLSFSNPRGVPAVFDVQIAGEMEKRAARVRWRFTTAVGVEFSV
jgi:hypothetical protein